MAVLFPILLVVALGVAWHKGVRDWATLAVIAFVGPVAGVALLTAVWTAVQPIVPILLPVAAIGVGLAVAQGSNTDKPKARQGQQQRELPPEAPKTSKKRRLDAE